jgi:hypothetical protein
MTSIQYTNFQDEVRGVREEDVVPMPKMTGAQYEKKVRDYLKNHTDHLVIHRLRTNQPLTETDLNPPYSPPYLLRHRQAPRLEHRPAARCGLPKARSA